MKKRNEIDKFILENEEDFLELFKLYTTHLLYYIQPYSEKIFNNLEKEREWVEHDVPIDFMNFEIQKDIW